MVSSGTVQGDLGSLSSAANDVTSTISGLSGSWQGASFNGISANIDSVISECLSIITSQMNSFASACDLYKEYEEVKKNLATAKSNYNNADQDHKSQYSSQISTLQTKLDTLKTQIEGALAGCNASLPGSSSNTSIAASGDSTSITSTDASALGSTTSALGTPTYGSFTRETFTSSNGTQITYMLYKPSYNGSTSNSGLPVHMYLTGANMTGSGEQIMTYGGVGKNLKEKTINPSGIVVIPHVPSGKQYENANYRTALTELATTVCKENNGDSNRISLGGHSYGAITAYRLVQEHPNTFSAIVPVSGSAKITNANAFSNVKIWAFHGARDNPGNNTNYTQAVQVINALQSAGVKATLHAYEDYPNCYHTHTANTTFSNEFDSPDGKKENPLEWAFEQKKA